MDFLPSTGKILRLREPEGPGIRHDSGIYEKYEVPIFYDPLLSKLVIYGQTRAEVIQRAKRAFTEFVIAGIRTNLPFHQWLLHQPGFEKGDYDTHFIDEHFRPEFIKKDEDLPLVALAAATLAYHQHGRRMNFAGLQAFSRRPSRWKLAARKEAVTRRQS